MQGSGDDDDFSFRDVELRNLRDLQWDVRLAREGLKLDCVGSRAISMELGRDAPGGRLRVEATRNNRKEREGAGGEELGAGLSISWKPGGRKAWWELRGLGGARL